jgi:hypothetical protein
VERDLYHLRKKGWQGFFWAVRPSRRQAFQVRGGVFGRTGGKYYPLRGVGVEPR